ncbi:MAG: N-acetyl-gamma-glutamyl-phosphate reductase [Nanoarchaeota archaeon]|nr:N-acetyl-gamma-glutamyl-phosphate reductase [Nanoarchaeota archaeon]
MKKINVGIIGGTGYSGGELCRLLLNHNHIKSILPTSREDEDFERIHQNLLGSGLNFTNVQDLEKKDLDVVFFCTPSGEAMKSAPKFLEKGVKVIDVSADFRFKDPELYKEVYGEKHKCPELLEEAAYGITELNREEIKNARLVANPGCYVITAVLGLYPLVKKDMVHLENIVISAHNGTTGAGNKPKRSIMHAEAASSILPYSIVNHRHSEEIEDQLENVSQQKAIVKLTPGHLPIERGIYAEINVLIKEEFRKGLTRDKLLKLYKECYGRGADGEFFVRINDFKKTKKGNSKEYDIYPFVANVSGSNFCHIGLDYDKKRGYASIIAVTDNIVKGAAGSAIQNMNVMFGFDEKEGLTNYGL